MTPVRLGEAEPAIRAALERLAESPRELLCYVIIESTLTKRFVQFCTPPFPSPFADSPRLIPPDPKATPLIFDGTGSGKPGGYTCVQTFCNVAQAVAVALETLRIYLPAEAELRIIEESAENEEPS